MSYTLHHTPSQTPYIPLPTSSPTPIYLTPLYPTDDQAWAIAMAIPEVNHHLIAPPYPYTTANAKSWISHVLSGDDGPPLSALREGNPETGKIIGGCSLAAKEPASFKHLFGGNPSVLERGEDTDRSCKIGYWLHPNFRGLGIMIPAVRALIFYGKEICGVTEIKIRVAEYNVASMKVVEGMKEWVMIEGEEKWQVWPESKGGGKKKVLSWKWAA